jgi:dTDP-4-amino-4,6-dideoxygalactose transaminase
MIVPFNDLTTQHATNHERFRATFDKLMMDSDFILGQNVIEFENKFKDYVGSKFALGVANGSDALKLAILAKQLPENSHILVAANTYFAAAAAIVHSGFVPKFFDVQLDNRFPSQSDIESVLTLESSLIIRSHLFGEADVVNVINIDQLHDCSQAHGTLIGGHHVGSGSTCTFSFYPGKNLGAFGDAGLITTNSIHEYTKLSALRNQGTLEDRYIHNVVGFNSRLDTIQANILLIKLAQLNASNLKRVKLANRYNLNLGTQSPRLRLFSSPPNVKSSYHLYQVFVDVEDLHVLQSNLQSKGISTGRHYPVPLPLQPAFRSLGYQKGDFPNSELLAKHSISLPIFPGMTNHQVDYVCENILNLIEAL